MPLGKFPDFAACVVAQKEKGKDDDAAKKICGYMEKKAKEGAYQPEIINKDGDLYLKTFLLDSSLNENSWGVIPDTIDNNIRSFIGKPYVVQENFGHPESNDTYDHHLQFQERFAIGRIQDIINKDGIYSALVKVTDDNARDAIREGDFPLYVSPQLWHEEEGQVPQNQMRRWKATHLAAVKVPAFGVKKARVISQCNGDSKTCLAQLKMASCKFCIKKTIENYKNAKKEEETVAFIPHNNPKIVSKNKNNNFSSLQDNERNYNSKLNDSNNDVNSQTDTQNQEQQVSIDEFNKLKQALEQTNAEKDALKQTNSQLSEENKTVSASLDSLKGEYRKDKVSSLLSSVFYKSDDERNKAVDSFTKSGMTYEEIDTHVAPLRSLKSASVSKLQQKSAEEAEQKETVVPAWMALQIGGSQ